MFNKKDLDEITYLVNGCAMKVHNTLGAGFQEVIYQRSLAIELERAGIKAEREVEQEVYYDGVVVGTRRADFVIGDMIIIEIKALLALEKIHMAQIMNYLEAYNFPIGLLLNFGATRLEYKKIYNNKFEFI